MSDILKSIRDDLESLCSENIVSKITLCEFDQRNATKIEKITGEQIRDVIVDTSN